MDVILSGLSLLHEPDEIIEIRSIDPKPVISGYFRADSPAIAKELSRYPNRTFYQTMNRVKSACYAREQHERLVERPHETTTDGDIAGYQWLLIDADPVRPSGVSASREEKEAARRVAGMTMKKLMAMGFSEPIVADSGNGYLMLIDEEGKLKKGPVSINCLASDLYGADRHGDAIVGNVMIVRAEDERLTLLTKDEANALAAGMEAMRDQAVEKISAAFGLKPIVKPELEIVDLSRRQSCRKNSMER